MAAAQRFRPLRSTTAKQVDKTSTATKNTNTRSTARTAAIVNTTTATTATTATTIDTVLASDVAQMTSTQSRLIVKTMLDATFGCVTFLRGLLPEDNFEDFQFAPSTSTSIPTIDSAASQGRSQTPNFGGGSQCAGDARKESKGLRIKKIRKGYSPEADKLLEWLDVGVMDAVDKRHLKSLVFAIYLDPDDPSNLIETITFNFFYHPLTNDDSGRKVYVPSVSIHDGIGGLTLGDSQGVGSAPKLKTVGEVKKALRKVIKSLIVTCQSLNDLPSKRWVTMKLLYMDGTPQEYEPPLFKPVPQGAPEWHLGTHSPDEAPWKTNVGSVDDGFHAMAVKIVSVADIIPAADSEKENDGTPWGSTAFIASSTISKRRRDEEEEQREDAAKRRFLWDAMDITDDRADIDPAYRDAEGEVSNHPPLPHAFRQKDSTTIPFKESSAPTYLMGAKDDRDVTAMRGAGGDLLKDLAQRKLNPLSNHTAAITQTYVSTGFRDAGEAGDVVGGELDIPQREESICSFSVPSGAPPVVSQFHDGVSARTRQGNTARKQTPECEDIVVCPCGFNYDDERPMVTCDTCDIWVHLACMGHATKATLPLDNSFVCLPCVIKGGSGEGLALLPTLALFRRMLDIMKEHGEVSERWELFVLLGISKEGKSRDRGTMLQDCTDLMDRMAREGFIELKPLDGPKTTKKRAWVWKAGNEARLHEYFCTGGKVDRETLGLRVEDYPYAVNPAHLERVTGSHADEVATSAADKQSLAKEPVDMGI